MSMEPLPAYRVDIAPAAWRQLGVVPADVFRQLRQRLDEVAASVAVQSLPQRDSVAVTRSSLYVVVANFTALYSVDHTRRTLTLLEVTRRIADVG
jgi:mRNA-degrading endonuclease RelE of RelBE toxin-antitoxin system